MQGVEPAPGASAHWLGGAELAAIFSAIVWGIPDKDEVEPNFESAVKLLVVTKSLATHCGETAEV